MRILLFSLLFFALSGCSSLSKNGSFELREYKEVTLKNGMRVLLIPDNSLPYISFEMLLGVGASEDPKDQLGLANLVASLLDQGTRNRNAIKLADDLGQMGATFSANVSADYTNLSASALSFHQEKLLEIFAEILTQPAFRPSDFKRVKRDILARLQKQVDDPGGFASQAFNDYVFGGHPYGNPVGGYKSTVKSIRQKHINRFYLKNFRPNNALLAVVGRFDGQMTAKLEEAFKSWSSGNKKTEVLPDFPAFRGRQLRLIHKSDLVQSQLRVGFKGVRRSNPDYLKIRMANTILGGGFSSRLNGKIRDQLGLTYSIYSSFDARRAEGSMYVSTFTRNAKVQETLSETLKILDEFFQKGVTQEEVASAKAQLIGRFPRAIETAERLAFNLLLLRFYGISDEYLEDFIDEVEDISVASVNEVIKKYYSPEDLRILVYSNKRQVKKQLSGFGDLEVINYQKMIR